MRRANLIAAGAIAGVALVAGAWVAVWRPSSPTPEIQASSSQPRDAVIPEEWREQHGEGTAFHDAVLSAAARKAVLQPARVTPVPLFASAAPERQIERLRAGKILVRSSALQQSVGAVGARCRRARSIRPSSMTSPGSAVPFGVKAAAAGNRAHDRRLHQGLGGLQHSPGRSG